MDLESNRNIRRNPGTPGAWTWQGMSGLPGTNWSPGTVPVPFVCTCFSSPFDVASIVCLHSSVTPVTSLPCTTHHLLGMPSPRSPGRGASISPRKTRSGRKRTLSMVSDKSVKKSKKRREEDDQDKDKTEGKRGKQRCVAHRFFFFQLTNIVPQQNLC
jgi:hypothetical protein